MRVTESIESAGYGISGNIGGIPRKTYWTPDGREIKAIPSLREYVKKDRDGKVIETGQRDANLDNGWFVIKPTQLKPYCPTCNKWHDTQLQLNECGRTQKEFVSRQEMIVRKEEQDKQSALEKEVAELKAMVNKLLEAKK